MPHRRGVRQAGLFLLVLGLLLLGTVVFMTRPRRLADLVGTFLTDLTGAQAHIESAWIRFDGTIELQHVSLTIPGMPEQPAQLFEAQTVVIRHHILSLLQGRFEARNLTFINPVLYLTQDMPTGRFNYQSLQALRQAGDSALHQQQLTRIPENLPNIFIRNGRLVLGEINKNGSYKVVGNSRFNGSFSSDPGTRSLYYFSLREVKLEQGVHPFLAGYLDIRTLAVEASLKGLDFDDPTMRNLLPASIRQWWDQLAPTGRVPNVRIGYDPNPNIGLFGLLDVSDVALTLPYTENKSRMTVHSGRFKVSDHQIQIQNLVGKIENFTYRINGTVDGLSPDAPFILTSKITGKITRQPRYAPWLGDQVKKAFEDISPSGNMQVNVRVQRKKLGGPFSYEGSVDINHASISYVTFPYPLTQVSGRITFDDKTIQLKNFHGQGPSGSQLFIKCSIDLLPKDDAQVTAQVSGVNLSIDDNLYAALAPKYRHLMDNLFSHERYAQLTDDKDGVIASSKQHQQWDKQRLQLLAELRQPKSLTADQIKLKQLQSQLLELKLKRPVFDLGGKTNMYLMFKRSLGDDQKNIIDSRYELKGVNVLLKKWPYPMQLSDGVFTLGPDGGKLDDAVMHGLNGGEAVIHGTMGWRMIDGQKKLLPEIKFTGSNFPVDNIVIQSLGERGHRILSSLGVSGTIDAAGMVLANDEGHPYPTLQIHLRDGSAHPFEGRYRINKLQGYIAVHDKDVQITEITGSNRNATFQLTGAVPEENPVSIKFTGQGIDLQPQVLDLIPPSTNKRQDAHRIIDPLHLTGLFDMNLHLYSDGHGTPWQSQLKLVPRNLNAVVKGQDIALTKFKGHVNVDGDLITLKELECHYGTGTASVSGNAHFYKGSAPKLNLSIDAQNQEICPVTRALLPTSVNKALTALKLNGRYHLVHSQLSYQPQTDMQPSQLHFKGQVKVADGTAMIGVPIKQMDGIMDLTVDQTEAHTMPEVSMVLKVASLRAADRLISPLTVYMDNKAAKGQVLFIQQFSGHCYNGLLHGQGQVAMDDSAAFMIRLTLQNADYGPMIYPNEPDTTKRSADALDRATLSADLTISGMEKDKQSQRAGRGSIAIRNANIYRFPLTMSIVQLLNLTTPTARKFNNADVQFLVDNDLINIEHIELMSPTINIAGSGTLQYSNQSLNLDMFTRNPGAPNLGPVSELFKMFKNELVGIHVGGTLENPVTTVNSLGGIKHTMSEILGKPSENRHKNTQADDGSPNTSGQ